MTQKRTSSRWLRLLVLTAVVAAVTILWNTPVVWPLKILTVFFHEISHGLACWLTGGTLGTITISPDESGLHMGAGGSRFIVLNAGYLGSLLWGCGLLLLAAWVKNDAMIIGMLSLFLAAITFWCVRNSFGLAFGSGTAIALMVIAKYGGAVISEIILQVIGITSALYVIPDVWSDVISHTGTSDATMLAEYTLIPTTVWGGAWLVLSVIVCIATLRWILKAAR